LYFVLDKCYILLYNSIHMEEYTHVYTDGGSRGNPGPSAIGFVIMFPDGVKAEGKKYIGTKTNNEAEYLALLSALACAISFKKTRILAFSDSELMVKQIKGLYTVKDEKLKKLYDSLIPHFVKLEEFHITHIPRERNKIADRLVNEALDEKLKNGKRTTNRAYRKKSRGV